MPGGQQAAARREGESRATHGPGGHWAHGRQGDPSQGHHLQHREAPWECRRGDAGLQLSLHPHGGCPGAAEGQPGNAALASGQSGVGGAGRRPLRVYPPWQAEPLSPGATDPHVVIEADATEAETRSSFTLKLWDADGTRSVIVTGVTFP
ncbi:MAG: DUF2381 family protein [Myxococcaceae bacterium]|nr:DUF2381 family protein [Myxococcaceae bacterium]